MLWEDARHVKPYVYATICGILEAVILLAGILGGFMMGIFMTILRIVMLVAAYCCNASMYAAFYSGFALIGALYCFDPVGLLITGHGGLRSAFQNVACIIGFLLSAVVSYIGYLLSVSLTYNQVNEENDQSYNAQHSFSSPVYRPTNNSYINPNQSQIRNRGNLFPVNRQHNERPHFQPFQGEGIVIG